ncbi:DUF2267 domain-containing protein [Georgenia sp. AZ-5]|uniref:DUF2267 domain-containing protein n=1 Tax=Georgenia sp. AZ-5 TaxID=3367526 RepID=UPI003753F497
MRQDEFLAKVRERGEYADNAEAERVTRAVLGMLGERLTGAEADDLAAQLPGDLGDALRTAPQEGGTFGPDDFVARLASAVDATRETALWDASAVLTTVAEAISGGQLNQLLSQLQSGYAELFGKPELA